MGPIVVPLFSARTYPINYMPLAFTMIRTCLPGQVSIYRHCGTSLVSLLYNFGGGNCGQRDVLLSAVPYFVTIAPGRHGLKANIFRPFPREITMSSDEKIEASETRITKAVFPQHHQPLRHPVRRHGPAGILYTLHSETRSDRKWNGTSLA